MGGLFCGPGGFAPSEEKGGFISLSELGLECLSSIVEENPNVDGSLPVDLNQIPKADSCGVGLEDLTLDFSPRYDFGVCGVFLVLGNLGYAANSQTNPCGDITNAESFIAEEDFDFGLSFLDYGVVWGHFFIPVRRVDLL